MNHSGLYASLYPKGTVVHPATLSDWQRALQDGDEQARRNALRRAKRIQAKARRTAKRHARRVRKRSER